MNNPDWNIRREAAVALGRLQDPNSCPQLIAMLEDDDRRVVSGALWALREMSERNFAANPELWESWHALELEWFEGTAVGLEAGLRSDDSAAVMRSVGLLCHRPLFRNHMARALGPLLFHDDPAIVRVVCSALLQLESQRAVPFLVERMEHTADESTEAVRSTLEGLTGLSLPVDAERGAWEDALGI